MNYKVVGRIISQILALEAVFMLPSVFLCIADGNTKTCISFLLTILIIAVVSVPMYLVCKNAKNTFYAKEGFVSVGLSWIFMSLAGALPFYFSGEIPSFINCFFEIVSGFTTTGASVVENVEVLSRGVLYWRSFSHWLGGMGVLVFLLAIAPMGGASVHLLRAESPGPSVGKLVPQMKKTAKILYLLYIVLTVVNFIFLIIGKMPVFDAVCTAFGTAGTGGFGTRADSMASFSPYIQVVCIVFAVIFGINFNMFYLLLIRNVKGVFKNSEIKLYLGTVVLATALIAVNISSMYSSVSEALRHSAFQVSTIMSTTGFASTDFNTWPAFSKAILLALMFMGGSAGSTAGGMKCARVELLFKTFIRGVKQTLHPQRIQHVRSNGQNVDEKVIQSMFSYLCAYVMILVLSFVLISVDGFSVETNVSAAVACFNNIGPGFDAVGPMVNYSGYSAFSKLVLIISMLAGRLELFPMLVLFYPSTWKK